MHRAPPPPQGNSLLIQGDALFPSAATCLQGAAVLEARCRLFSMLPPRARRCMRFKWSAAASSRGDGVHWRHRGRTLSCELGGIQAALHRVDGGKAERGRQSTQRAPLPQAGSRLLVALASPALCSRKGQRDGRPGCGADGGRPPATDMHQLQALQADVRRTHAARARAPPGKWSTGGFARLQARLGMLDAAGGSSWRRDGKSRAGLASCLLPPPPCLPRLTGLAGLRSSLFKRSGQPDCVQS